MQKAILCVKIGKLTSGQCESRTSVLNTNFSVTAGKRNWFWHSQLSFHTTLSFLFFYFLLRMCCIAVFHKRKSDVFFFLPQRNKKSAIRESVYLMNSIPLCCLINKEMHQACNMYSN